MTTTIGEIAKSHGFDNPSDYFNSLKKERDEFKTFKVGDAVILPKDYKPTHFKEEKCLPTETPLKISEVGDVNIFCFYQIKIEGFDSWFDAEIFN
jgi:hypothetical protein